MAVSPARSLRLPPKAEPTRSTAACSRRSRSSRDLNAYQRWNGPASVAPGTPAERGLLRDSDRYNQLGGSAGGPIWKNRVFAFFSYEGQSQTVPATGTGWYMNAAALAPIAPASSIASTYLNFPGAGVLGTLIGSANLQRCRTYRRGQLYTNSRSGPEHWFASYHRSGQTGFDIPGQHQSRPGQRALHRRGYWPSTARATRPAATSSNTMAVSTPT